MVKIETLEVQKEFKVNIKYTAFITLNWVLNRASLLFFNAYYKHKRTYSPDSATSRFVLVSFERHESQKKLQP